MKQNQTNQRINNNQNIILEKLTGSIERVTFHSPESGFCVLRVKSRNNRELTTVIGSAVTVIAGQYLECEGSWVNDKNHGLQFKSEKLKVVQPNTLEGIEKYLGSGLVKGIGPGFAKRLVKAFGAEVFNIIEEQPDKLSKLDGIGKKRKQQITTAWAEQKKIREIVMFLHSHGIGTARAVRIYKTYGDNAVDKIKENPYRLALDVYGIGFKTADLLATKLGIPKESLIRAQAGVRHILQQVSNQGHCAALIKQLITDTAELLEINQDIIDQAINAEISNGNLILEKFSEMPGVMLASVYHAEISLANRLTNLNAGETPWQDINLSEVIPWVEKETRLSLSSSQQHAIQIAITNKVTVITGGPGVGKTTIVNSILKIIQNKTNNILLAAPTGRAAKRLAESTSMQAKTLHRLLVFDPKTRGFKYNEEFPLSADLIIIDETSMVDVFLMHSLLKAIPIDCALILIGDVDQLPSVGAGAVLANIIDSQAIPTIRLTKIFRQAATSKIITNAHKINAGYLPTLDTDPTELTDFYFIKAQTAEEVQYKLIKTVAERIPQRFNLDPLQQIQVLSPMNRGSLGARSLNIELKKALNNLQTKHISRYGITFSIGDKVIQTINNYDKEVFNGDIGFIADLDLEENILLVNFDGRNIAYESNELDELQLAYATTIHKSQGSEYPAVVIPLAMQHFTLLERNLIYTGITRGKGLVVIIGQIKALAMAVKKDQSQQRLTKLKERLSHLSREIII